MDSPSSPGPQSKPSTPSNPTPRTEGTTAINPLQDNRAPHLPLPDRTDDDDALSAHSSTDAASLPINNAPPSLPPPTTIPDKSPKVLKLESQIASLQSQIATARTALAESTAKLRDKLDGSTSSSSKPDTKHRNIMPATGGRSPSTSSISSTRATNPNRRAADSGTLSPVDVAKLRAGSGVNLGDMSPTSSATTSGPGCDDPPVAAELGLHGPSAELSVPAAAGPGPGSGSVSAASGDEPAIRVTARGSEGSAAAGTGEGTDGGEDDLTAVHRAATAIVKRHIRLLHEYNEIKDIGQGLMGLIADGRGVRLQEVMAEFGVDGSD